MARTRKIVAPEATNPEMKSFDATEVEENDQDEMTPAHRRALDRAEQRKQFTTLSDQVAGETLFFRDHKWDKECKAFPDDIDAHMRIVSKFYPYSSAGKPLYVDEPRSERQIEVCYRKQKVMHKLGLRHVVIEPFRNTPEEGKPIAASTLDHCLEQLGEL